MREERVLRSGMWTSTTKLNECHMRDSLKASQDFLQMSENRRVAVVREGGL